MLKFISHSKPTRSFLGVLAFLHLVLVCLAAGEEASYQNVFLPKELAQSFSEIQKFPATWSGMILLDRENPSYPDLRTKLCRLSLLLSNKGMHLACPESLASRQRLLDNWIKDLPLRQAMPDAKRIRSQITQATTKLSFLASDDPLFELTRRDPLNTLADYLRHWMKGGPELQSSKQGRYDALAVNFDFPPSQMTQTALLQPLWQSLCKDPSACSELIFLGAHFAALKNQNQVQHDLRQVSWLGILLFVGFLLLLIKIRRTSLLFIFFVVFGSAALALFLTNLFFGGVHGLTLAFSPVIIGLGLDYGFHYAIGKRRSWIWKPNLVGFLTTWIVLILAYGSKIPLVQQLMFASGLGLLFAYGLFYLLYEKTKWGPTCAAFDFKPFARPYFNWITLCLLVTAIWAAISIKPKLDLSALEYFSDSERSAIHTFHAETGFQSPVFEVLARAKGGSEPLFQLRERFSVEQGIPLISSYSFLPSPDLQAKHLASWKGCKWKDFRFDENEKVLFAPFIKNFNCGLGPKPYHLWQDVLPPYLEGLVTDRTTLLIWRVQTPEQESVLRLKFPEAVSLKELAGVFAKELNREVSLLASLSLVLVSLILWIFYRKDRIFLVTLIPFAWGFGLVYLAIAAGWLQLSFISLIALMVVFGFSIDYGVFSAEALQRNDDKDIWSVLFCSALSTGTGLIPLLFCDHPVLKDLAGTMVLGTLGTLGGTFFGVPSFYAWRSAR